MATSFKFFVYQCNYCLVEQLYCTKKKNNKRKQNPIFQFHSLATSTIWVCSFFKIMSKTDQLCSQRSQSPLVSFQPPCYYLVFRETDAVSAHQRSHAKQCCVGIDKVQGILLPTVMLQSAPLALVLAVSFIRYDLGSWKPKEIQMLSSYMEERPWGEERHSAEIIILT